MYNAKMLKVATKAKIVAVGLIAILLLNRMSSIANAEGSVKWSGRIG